MALVSYEYDSAEDNEENEEEDSTSTVIIQNKTPLVKETQNSAFHKALVTEDVPGILSQLPKSKTRTVNIIESNLEEFVPKYKPPDTKEKKSHKVKITIPSLSEFEEDEDEPLQKRVKPSLKGSGLLSLLPPVQGSPLSTKSFVPNVVKNKQPAPGKSKTNLLVPNAVKKTAELAKKAAITKMLKSSDGSDLESDDEFEIPESFDDEIWQKVCGRKIKPKVAVVQQDEEVIIPKGIESAPDAEKPYDGLDNAAFKELVGKAKRPVNVKLIDINEDEIVSDKNMWLTKSLTDPETAPKLEIEDPVDPTRKKKHHITYLAEQAKANEQELQSQWSSSKYNRNQTRAKYGF